MNEKPKTIRYLIFVTPNDLEKWLQRTDPYNLFGDEDKGGHEDDR